MQIQRSSFEMPVEPTTILLDESSKLAFIKSSDRGYVGGMYMIVIFLDWIKA